MQRFLVFVLPILMAVGLLSSEIPTARLFADTVAATNPTAQRSTTIVLRTACGVAGHVEKKSYRDAVSGDLKSSWDYVDTITVNFKPSLSISELYLVGILEPLPGKGASFPEDAYIVRLDLPLEKQPVIHHVRSRVRDQSIIPRFYLAAFVKNGGNTAPIFVQISRQSFNADQTGNLTIEDSAEAAAQSKLGMADSYHAAKNDEKARQLYLQILIDYPTTNVAEQVRQSGYLSAAEIATATATTRPAGSKDSSIVLAMASDAAELDPAFALSAKQRIAVAAQIIVDQRAAAKAAEEQANSDSEELDRNLSRPQFVRDLWLKLGASDVRAESLEQQGETESAIANSGAGGSLQAQVNAVNSANNTYERAKEQLRKSQELIDLLAIAEKKNAAMAHDQLLGLIADTSIDANIRLKLSDYNR